jgi:transglutaminase-like putative cysteine protease
MAVFERALFLAPCDVIDWRSTAVRELAARITSGVRADEAICALFNWVRDVIPHTADVGQGRLTLRASEVLSERTGICYAKSHLLVALLRASEVPAGLCYQRLCSDDASASFVLHGLVGVLMPDQTFLRIDPRGNKLGIDVQFAHGREALAFTPSRPGEADLPGVFVRPIPEVVAALSGTSHWHPSELALPDVEPEHWPAPDAHWHTPAT